MALQNLNDCPPAKAGAQAFFFWGWTPALDPIEMAFRWDPFAGERKKHGAYR